MYLILAIIISLITQQIKTEECITPNNEKAECISLYACPIIINALSTKQQTSIEFVRQSNCGGTPSDPLVCCGSSAHFTAKENKKTPEEKINLLPSRRYCGYQHSDDYFTALNDSSVAISEFPWLAAIVSKVDGKLLPRCGGSLINNRYVLSAAHCFSKWAPKLDAVYLGEYDVNNETDCIKEPQFEEECSSPIEILGVEKIIPHPMYSSNGHSNDIALLRLNKSVSYSDYIRPICLPLPGTNFAKVGDVLTTSGWGLKQHSDGLKGVNIKKKVLSKLIENEECRKLYEKGTHGSDLEELINTNVLCSIPVNKSSDLACQGDSGGPLLFSHRKQWHQEGVLSFGKGCDGESPRGYAKVANYIDWILENIEP